MIHTVFNGAITILLAKFVLNDVPHALYGNPDGSITSEIIERAGMRPYEYKWFPIPEEERKPRVHPYVKTRFIGPYAIKATGTKDGCNIRLYEHLEGWRRRLVATWTGIERGECDAKFEEVTSVIRQVRYEHKTTLGMQPG